MPLPDNSGVRAATRDDRRAVSILLGAAFQNDPVMRFIFPNDNDRRSRLPRLFSILYDGDGAHGARLVTQGFEAATLWRAPGQGHLSLFEKLRYGPAWIHAAGFSLIRALTVSAASDAAHPADPHWYLHIAGAHPESQRSGYGTAAIAPGLERADRERVNTYLETANEDNIAFYVQFGFKITHEWRVPNGPLHWSMLRKSA